ncbi:glycosyltransferase [Alteromonas pelagimontana]|uniref:Glycosyltransferase n=1 Tax=Alteromonas pelagimontana TaxID=1858656 RepID=A0A6M4MHA0_9ALTE|nr:glycosyltransferase [Alteromonas pelagimontana]QJR81970.1 glycosyltransferase [Alteromonas pelagimontana]
MKILHIASGDKWAGAEVQVWTLCSQLVKNGHDVSAIVLNEGRLAELLRIAGVKVTVYPESSTGFKSLLAKFRQHFNTSRPDVIHTHRQKENILGAIANRLSIKVPCFRTIHGAPEFTPSWKQRIQISADEFCGRYLQQGIVSVSEDLTRKLSDTYPRKKIHTIDNGIDVEQVKADAESAQIPPLPADVIHIGFVGRIEPVKRVDLFLETAKILLSEHSQHHQFHFHIFGDGAQRQHYQQIAENTGISQHVTFYGHTDLVRGWISKMTLLLMPSDHEGLPMTALESLALGVPMVAHATGGLIPLLNEGQGSGLVEHHEAKAYTNGVLKVLSLNPYVNLPLKFLASENAKKLEALYRR